MDGWKQLAPYWVTEDRIVSEDRFELWGFVIVASVDGGDATLYNQRSAEAHASLGTYKALASSPTVIMFPRGIELDRGLFVDIGGNITGVLVIGTPIFQPPE